MRAKRVEPLARARRHERIDERWHGRGGIRWRARPVARLGVAVDGDVGEIGQEFCGAILSLHLPEQLRRRIDEAGGVAHRGECRMAYDRFEEGQVRRDAADAEFAQGAVHPRDRPLRRRRPSGDLLQQWVVIAGDDCAGIGGAAVETDAETGRGTIAGDAPVVGNKVLVGILGGDPALHGVAVEADIRLRRHARDFRADGMAFEDMDLRLDDVDAGDEFGNRVLDLDRG